MIKECHACLRAFHVSKARIVTKDLMVCDDPECEASFHIWRDAGSEKTLHEFHLATTGHYAPSE